MILIVVFYHISAKANWNFAKVFVIKIFFVGTEILRRYEDYCIHYARSYFSHVLVSFLYLTFSGIRVKRELRRAKNRDEKRDGQREQLRSQLSLVIRVPAYQNAAARTPYVAIIAREHNLSRAIIAPRLQIYRSLVIERYVIPVGHMEMFIARPANRE